jgi:excisionase family DNA binding protein
LLAFLALSGSFLPVTDDDCHRPSTGWRHYMERFAYSVKETARLLSMGRTSIYVMIADGRLESLKLGRRTLIKGDSIRRLVDGRA